MPMCEVVCGLFSGSRMNLMIEHKGIYVSVIEYGVQNYPRPEMAHDPKTGTGGWRFMRIEYWHKDEPYAFLEHHVWMPPGVGSGTLEDWMNERIKELNEP